MFFLNQIVVLLLESDYMKENCTFNIKNIKITNKKKVSFSENINMLLYQKYVHFYNSDAKFKKKEKKKWNANAQSVKSRKKKAKI